MKAWPSPTRRAFLTMLGAGAAAVALRTPLLRALGATSEAEPAPAAPVAEAPAAPTIWIGHC